MVVCSIHDGLAEIKVHDQSFIEEGQVYFADPSAFDLLALTTQRGNPSQAVTEPFKTVLTESSAKKYFGRTDIIGESVEIEGHPYQVSAVINDVPANTHLKFVLLLSHASRVKVSPNYKEDQFQGNDEYTYLLMDTQTNLAEFNSKLIAPSASMPKRLENMRYVAQPMVDIHLQSNKTYELEVNGDERAVTFLLIIAVFVIIIAWVNCINLSTARAMAHCFIARNACGILGYAWMVVPLCRSH